MKNILSVIHCLKSHDYYLPTPSVLQAFLWPCCWLKPCATTIIYSELFFFLRQYKQQLNFLLNNEVILYIPLKSTQTFHCKTSFLIFSTSYDTSHILIFILIEVSVGPLQWEFSTWMWRIIFHHMYHTGYFNENDRLFLQLNQNGTTDTSIYAFFKINSLWCTISCQIFVLLKEHCFDLIKK